ncbi:DUF7344 domain-containing protein [Haladaptatus sp. NG-WS-4]
MVSPESDTLDTAFSILSNPHRRRLLSHLADSSDTATTVEELAGLFDDHATELRLRHVHLPLLDATSAVDYDDRTETVRYRESSLVEELLTHCSEDQRAAQS